MATFGGEEFINMLSSNPNFLLPSTPLTLTLTGMVKPLAIDPLGGLMFSPGTSCAVWVSIPSKMIDKVDHLGKVSCREHEHELVRLHFKIPTNDEGRVLTELLHQQEALFSVRVASMGGASMVSPMDDISFLRSEDGFGDRTAAIGTNVQANMNRFGGFDRWRCYRCVASNLALGLAVTAAVAAMGPAIGAATAVSSLMAQFGISEAVAIAAVGGASGATIARMMCHSIC